MPVCKVRGQKVIIPPSDSGFIIIIPNQTNDGKPITASRIRTLLVKQLKFFEEHFVLVEKLSVEKVKYSKPRRS